MCHRSFCQLSESTGTSVISAPNVTDYYYYYYYYNYNSY